MAVWRWGVILSGLLSAGALVFLIFKARSFGRRPAFSSPQRSPFPGIAYALSKGMMPWEKESARLHLLSYLAGVLYHLGIFSGFAVLFAKVVDLKMPALGQNIFRFGLGLGLLSGLGLLLKRILMPNVRRLSRPDDFGANVFVDVFLAAALAASLNARAVTFLMGYSIFLFLYIPAGKIRHCVFFFYSRVLFGWFFGRRGVLPPRRERS
ncbi:MAG TPA: hypothetical protein VGB72_04490 [Acidobacteriota bacterium]